MKLPKIYALSGEGLGISQMTFRQLRDSVSKYATALKKIGVQKGDRVVGKSYRGTERGQSCW